MFKTIRLLLACCVLMAIANSCSKVADHNSLTDPQLGKDLLQQINENPNLSRFAELLVQSGYDKVLSASKTFTVWAPTNTALTTLDPTVVSDTARLRLFVGNHIANQMYATNTVVSQLRIPMINGKYLNMKGTIIDSTNIIEANHYAKNGLLHIIDKAIPVLSNSWEILTNNSSLPAKQKAFMLSLMMNVFDPTNAIITGVDTSGRPIYQPGTDSVRTNLFWRNVYDLRTEARQYTLFVVADNSWDAEVAKFRPYFVTGTTDSTARLTSFDVVKDYAFDSVYTQATLPDTLISRSGVKVPINKAGITQSIKTSNGVIFVVNQLPVTPTAKLREFRIEGEGYRSASHSRIANTYFRDRVDSLGKSFKDVLVINHGVALFWLNYRISAVNSVKYRAYWVAVNDFQTATYQQRLAIGLPTATNLPYYTVPLNRYAEQYLGEFTMSAYSPTLDLYLVGANSTAQAVNPLVCDYIRLVPVP